MALLLLLLPLPLLLPPLLPGLGPSLVSAQKLNLRSVVRRNYDMAKLLGAWYSISMASDDVKRIGEHGDLRVFIQNIKSVNNGSLEFFFRFLLQGECADVAIVCEKTEKEGEYTLVYEGDNRVLLLETDYNLYSTFYLRNVRNGTETQVLALYGRIAELTPSFLGRFERICRKYRLGQQNIINLSRQDPCLLDKR